LSVAAGEQRAAGGRAADLEIVEDGRFATLGRQAFGDAMRVQTGASREERRNYMRDKEQDAINETDSEQDEAGVERDASHNVTREQGGQFLQESEGVLPVTWEKASDVMQQSHADHVEAAQVQMDRSAAESINAQRMTMSNSGAKAIEARSIKLDQSGSVFLNAERATFNNSSAVVAKAGDLRLNESSLLLAAADSASIESGAKVGLLVVRTIEAKGDVRAFALIGRDVTVGGNVSSVLNTASAAALGAGCAFVLLFAKRLFGGSR